MIRNLSADTSRYRDSTAELIKKYLPGTKVRDGFPSHFGGLDNSRVKDVLEFEAQHLWQNYITPEDKSISQYPIAATRNFAVITLSPSSVARYICHPAYSQRR